MKGIRIKDLHEGKYLSFDLVDVLPLLGERATRSKWLVSDIWATMKQIDQSMELDRSWFSWEELQSLATGAQQIIDGRFEGYEVDEEKPWVIVLAVDSSYWEIISSDTEVIEAVAARFFQVEILSDDEIRSIAG